MRLPARSTATEVLTATEELTAQGMKDQTAVLTAAAVTQMEKTKPLPPSQTEERLVKPAAKVRLGETRVRFLEGFHGEIETLKERISVPKAPGNWRRARRKRKRERVAGMVLSRRFSNFCLISDYLHRHGRGVDRFKRAAGECGAAAGDFDWSLCSDCHGSWRNSFCVHWFRLLLHPELKRWDSETRLLTKNPSSTGVRPIEFRHQCLYGSLSPSLVRPCSGPLHCLILASIIQDLETIPMALKNIIKWVRY